MTRKGFWLGIFFVLGAFLAQTFTTDIWWVFLLGAVCLGLIIFLFGKKIRHYVVVCTLSAVLGVAIVQVYTNQVYDEIVSNDGRVITINGYVENYNYIGSDFGYLTVHGKVNGHNTNVDFLVENDDFEDYDYVSVTGKVTTVKNSYDYPSADYGKSTNHFLTGTEVKSITLTGGNANPLFREIHKYSQNLYGTIKFYAGGDEGAFLGAMLCGDKSNLSDADKTMLYRSGIGHIFAVSGTHLVVVVSFLYLFLNKLISNKKITTCILLLSVWAFAVFAGMTVSVVRSAIIMTLVYAADLVTRKSDCANSLGIAGLMLTVANPYVVCSPSFLLSFLSAFGAGVIAPAICKRYTKNKSLSLLLRSIVTTVAILLMTAPIMLFKFGGISAAAIISNLLLVPLCTLALWLCIILIFTGGIVVIAKPVLYVAAFLIKIVLAGAKLFADIPLSYITVENTSGKLIISLLCVGAIIFALLSRKINRSAIACVIVFISSYLTMNVYALVRKDCAEFYVLPQGRHSEVIMLLNEKAYIFDIGAKCSANSAVMRLLSEKSVTQIQSVFIDREGYYSYSLFCNEVYPRAEQYFISDEYPQDNKEIFSFETGSTVSSAEALITKSEKGYCIEYNDVSYSFEGKSYKINDKEYSTDEYAVSFSSDDITVRRLDYEFSYGGYAW